MAKKKDKKDPTADATGGSNDLERLIGHALMDPDFRVKLVEDPKGAAASIGIELDDYQIARLSSLNPAALAVVAAAFKEGTGLGIPSVRLW
jgi:hypothetical protein